MYKSPYDPGLMPGTWNLWKKENLLFFACPKCADVFVILRPVGKDGIVEGKVRCMQPGCPFEEEVRLVGWK